jgi:hypothetical protein
MVEGGTPPLLTLVSGLLTHSHQHPQIPPAALALRRSRSQQNAEGSSFFRRELEAAKHAVGRAAAGDQFVPPENDIHARTPQRLLGRPQRVVETAGTQHDQSVEINPHRRRSAREELLPGVDEEAHPSRPQCMGNDGEGQPLNACPWSVRQPLNERPPAKPSGGKEVVERREAGGEES